MKTIILFILTLVTTSTKSYVPTVEGLFRHGNNPEVTTNALVLTASVQPHNPFVEGAETTAPPLWVKWIYNVTPHGKLKLTQLIYSSAAMSDATLLDKIYVAELSPQSFPGAQTERGLFLALLNSILINDGSFMIDFLQHHGVSVAANTEILNQEKIALLTRYRSWLSQTKGGRVAGTEESPLAPNNPAEKERVSRIMSSPMYLDSGKVSLSRHQGEPAWHVRTENFEAFVDDAKREIRQLTLRQSSGETEISCTDPMLLNGSHRVPKRLIVKTTLDQHYAVTLLSLRHFNETQADLLARLQRYDQVLGAKKTPVERPSFLF